MSRNVELKARLADLNRGREVARSLRAELHDTELQCDSYFRAAVGRLKLRQRWKAHESDVVGSIAACNAESARPSQLIWYRRVDAAQVRPSDYTLVEFADGEAIRTMLEGALGLTIQVFKHRVVFLFDQVRIHLDQVDGLGTFLEFEAIVSENCDTPTAARKVEMLRNAFGLDDKSLMSTSYSDLLLEARTGRSS